MGNGSAMPRIAMVESDKQLGDEPMGAWQGTMY